MAGTDTAAGDGTLAILDMALRECSAVVGRRHPCNFFYADETNSARHNAALSPQRIHPEPHIHTRLQLRAFPVPPPGLYFPRPRCCGGSSVCIISPRACHRRHENLQRLRCARLHHIWSGSTTFARMAYKKAQEKSQARPRIRQSRRTTTRL